MICFPTRVEPVNETLRTRGWVTKRSPTTGPSPGRIVSTCSGSPASRASSPIRSAVSGVSSAGLEHDAVAGRERGGQPPAGHRHREVPRHDDADDAEGLVERDVGAAGHAGSAGRRAVRARRRSSSGSRGRSRPPSGRWPRCGRRCGPRSRRAPRRGRRRLRRTAGAAPPARRGTPAARHRTPRAHARSRHPVWARSVMATSVRGVPVAGLTTVNVGDMLRLSGLGRGSGLRAARSRDVAPSR